MTKAEVFKTIIYNDHLDMEIKAKFLANFLYRPTNYRIVSSPFKIYMVLDYCFDWSESPEGHKYWLGIYDSFEERNL